VKLLLDTHVLLWALSDAPQLSNHHRALLNSDAAEFLVSSVSVWEISIKRALGKLIAPSDLLETVKSAGCIPLSISWAHADKAGDLPPHHADPFDRLLIAQSQLESIPLVTEDRLIAKYDLEIFS